MKKSLRIMLAVAAVMCVLSLSQAAEALSIVSSFDDGYVDEEYSSSVYVTGGTEPYDWNPAIGDLPPGLDGFPEGSNDDTMVISGTPTSTGRYTFTLEVSDMEGETTSKTFKITIRDSDGEDRTSFSSGSGGCNLGLAGLGLVLVAGLAFRKTHSA